MSPVSVQMQLTLDNGQLVEAGSEIRLTVKGVTNTTLTVGQNGWIQFPAEWRQREITSFFVDHRRDKKTYKLKKLPLYIPMSGDIKPENSVLIRSR